MEKGDLFWWLVDYHCNVNLPQVLPNIKDGVLNSKKSYREGSDKDVPYQGVLIIANGDTLADRLYEDELVNEPPGEFRPIPSKSSLSDYLDQEVAEDGAYVYDCTHNRIAKVNDINNTPPGLSRDFPIYSQVPSDFVSVDGKLPVGPDTIGTKTRLAIKIPAGYARFGAEAFQIKRSRYGTLGMGKVTHFTDQGLVKEFLFAYDPSSKGSFVDRRKGIIGLLRTYQRDSEWHLYRASESMVDPSKLK